MIFDEKFLIQIKNEPIEGTLKLCKTIRENLTDNPEGWQEQDYEILLEALALIEELNIGKYIETNFTIPTVRGILPDDCTNIIGFIDRLEEQFVKEVNSSKFEKLKAHFKINLSESFQYEFSQGDLEKIQNLLNELREQISSSDKFADDHKQRLLSRLEKLQSELHKKMSDLDRFWGLIGDAGVAVGKFGNDVKPIVDRIEEITRIVWRTQVRAEELPSDSPLPKLEDKSTDN